MSNINRSKILLSSGFSSCSIVSCNETSTYFSVYTIATISNYSICLSESVNYATGAVKVIETNCAGYVYFSYPLLNYAN